MGRSFAKGKGSEMMKIRLSKRSFPAQKTLPAGFTSVPLTRQEQPDDKLILTD